MSGGLGQLPLKDQFPFRVFVGQDDITTLVDDNFTFSSVDPGGYEMCSLVVPKDLPQVLRGMAIRIDCGLSVAWEGRVSEIERSLGNQTTITGEGYGALLKDNNAAMIFVDRDLTYWEGPSVQRQINDISSGFSPSSSEVQSDATTGNPALVFAATGSWAAGALPVVESLYDAQGVPLGSIYYSVNFGASVSGVFAGTVYLSTTDTLAAVDSAAFSGNIVNTLAASTDDRVFAVIEINAGSPGGTDNFLYAVYFDDVAVYGNHGLTPQGSAPYGFFPSQIAQWAMGQAVGLQAGVIQVTDDTGYIIPHSVYYAPTELDQIVDDMATANGWHWGVWESLAPLTGNAAPRLDFRPRPIQGQWTATALRSDCETCNIQEDLAGMYDTAVITYTDVVGNSRAVTVTTDNPVLDAAGIHRSVSLAGGTMDEDTASTFGAMALDLLYNQARVAGSVTISTAIDSMTGPMPAWLLKPGIDRIRIIDLPTTDAYGELSDIPISRMECSGSTEGYKVSLEVGTGANLVETLQARLGSAATLAAQGGS